MKLKDFLTLYDGHGTICINDDNLNCVCKGNFWNPRLMTLNIAKSLLSVSTTTNFV